MTHSFPLSVQPNVHRFVPAALRNRVAKAA